MTTAARQMYRYTNEEVARICHEANRALQNANQDPLPSVPWDAESEEIKASTVAGVMAARQGIMPRESHDRWIKARAAQGWAYGPEKDPVRRTHPNMVRYEDLPESEQVKDRLFIAIITALTCGVLGLSPLCASCARGVQMLWKTGLAFSLTVARRYPGVYRERRGHPGFMSPPAPIHAGDRAGRCPA